MRAVLETLAEREEFGAPRADPAELAMEWIAERLRRLPFLSRLEGIEGDMLAWVLFGLVALAIAVLLLVALRRLRARRVAPGPARVERENRGHGAVDWLAAADEAWTAGRARDAFAALYSAAVAALAARGLVTATPAKLARAYTRELGAAPERDAFRRVVDDTYAVMFGARDAAPRWSRAREATAALVPPRAGEESS